MYLSLLKLSRQQSKELKITDTYSLHRVVYSCFAKSRNDFQESSGILFAEMKGDALVKQVLVLSAQEPLAPFECQMQTKEIPAQFFDFPQYQFEIVVNPVKRDNATRKLIPMRTRQEVADWFSSRAGRWGFRVVAENFEVADIFVDSFRKDRQILTLGKARVKGLLEVEDKEAFLRAVSSGLGKGKAFGCGLLQLAP